MKKQEWDRKRMEFKKIFGYEPPLDRLMLMSASFALDIFEVEKRMPNYDGVKCEYKGKPEYSMDMAVTEEYGERACELILEMLL